MAKVNLWLRGARGKFAGTSLSKGANGETIAREVVTPFNPNTDKQLYQRMIMATVMAAYGAGKEIFDHSFQGMSKGSACQQYFMQRNLQRLRSAVADEIRNIENGDLTAAKCQNIIVGPKTHTPVPGKFLVSEGNYQQQFFKLTMKTDNSGFSITVPMVQPDETVAEYAKRLGLVPGDIYTLVAFSVDVEGDSVWIGRNPDGSYSSDNWLHQSQCYFQYWRIQVKNDVLTNTATVAALKNGAFNKQFFDLTAFNIIGEDNDYRLNNPLNMTFNAAGNPSVIGDTVQYDFNVGSYAIIRSRFDKDLRSTTYMETAYHFGNDDELEVGLSCGSALSQWKQQVQSIGTSNLILESGS